MHFAYPARKSSDPPPFRPRTTQLPSLRRGKLSTVAIVLFLVLGGWWLLSGPASLGGLYRERTPSGDPEVVIVTVIDPSAYSNTYLNTVKENREEYAKKHGYATHIVKAYEYETKEDPSGWSTMMAARHALTKFPNCKYLWVLEQHAYIMDSTKSLEDQVLGPKKLESLMIKDQPVVPPDSVIHSFGHLKAHEVDLTISQDAVGLNIGSFVVRNGDWAKFFLETWLDPLYKSYNFQKAERHALEHLVQWHPTVLAKLALVPQQSLGTYTNTASGQIRNPGEAYNPGDFVVIFNDCEVKGVHSCEAQANEYLQRWKEAFSKDR